MSKSRLDRFIDSIRPAPKSAYVDVSAAPAAAPPGSAYRILLAPGDDEPAELPVPERGDDEGTAPAVPGAPRKGTGKVKAKAKAKAPPAKAPPAKAGAAPDPDADPDDDEDDEPPPADDDDDDEDEESESKPPPKQTRKPAKVQVSADELKDLREKARKFEESESEKNRRADERAKEREDKLAAEDPAKALEAARRRYEKRAGEKDKTIADLQAERDELAATLAKATIDRELRDNLTDSLTEVGATLRTGAKARLMRELAERFEAVPDEDSEDPRALVVRDRESGESPAKTIVELLKSEDYALFLDFGDGTSHPPAGKSRGNPNASKEVGKNNSFSASYKRKQKDAQATEGYMPARGLYPPTGRR